MMRFTKVTQVRLSACGSSVLQEENVEEETSIQAGLQASSQADPANASTAAWDFLLTGSWLWGVGDKSILSYEAIKDRKCAPLWSGVFIL